jgi:5-methylcytosine-specific restriction endonuclease McrA
MKSCEFCKLKKPLIAFSKYKTTKDGFARRCKECEKERKYRYQKENAELYSIKRKLYRQKNKEAITAYHRLWTQKNLLKKNLYSHKRRNLLKENGSFEIIAKDIKRLKASDCFYCGSKDNLQIDHIIPIAKGGRHSIGNLVMACQPCNGSKNDKFLYSWLVSK